MVLISRVEERAVSGPVRTDPRGMGGGQGKGEAAKFYFLSCMVATRFQL